MAAFMQGWCILPQRQSRRWSAGSVCRLSERTYSAAQVLDGSHVIRIRER